MIHVRTGDIVSWVCEQRKNNVHCDLGLVLHIIHSDYSTPPQKAVILWADGTMTTETILYLILLGRESNNLLSSDDVRTNAVDNETDGSF